MSFECDKCLNVFRQRSYLQRHQKTKCYEKTAHTCDRCLWEFTTRRDLQRHLNRKNTCKRYEQPVKIQLTKGHILPTDQDSLISSMGQRLAAMEKELLRVQQERLDTMEVELQRARQERLVIRDPPAFKMYDAYHQPPQFAPAEPSAPLLDDIIGK